jgi:branched-chain amino acid aminotransferase
MTDAPVWVNGTLGGRIDPRDRGLTLGDGVFDTLVAFRGVPFAGARHLDRLVNHAAAIGIALDPDQVRTGWNTVLHETRFEHAIIRTTVTRGVTGRGLWPTSETEPTIVVSAAPWSTAIVAKRVRLITSTIPRHAGSPAARLKTIGYLDNVLAAREANAADADDALMLNHRGRIACTTIANVFALAESRLTTPPVTDGVMAGTMRGLVMELAADAGLKAAEDSLTAADLAGADYVFVTNSVRLLSPVLSVDDRAVGGRSPGAGEALLGLIADRIKEECGIDPLSRD